MNTKEKPLFFHNLSIRAKIFLGVVVPVLCIIVIALALFSYREINATKQNLVKNVTSISQAMSQDFVKILLLRDANLSVDIVERMRAFPDIKAAYVYKDPDSIVFAYIQPGFEMEEPPPFRSHQTEFTKDLALIFHPLEYKGKKYGTVNVNVSTTKLQNQFQTFVKLTIALLLIFTLGSILLAYIIQKKISKPIHHLVEIVQEFSRGKQDVKAEVRSLDEIGKLALAFNKMVEETITQQMFLRRINMELEEANRHKSEFLANMSHELRTPINSMIGYTSLVYNALQNSIPRKHLKNLGNAGTSARSLLQIINDILDFSKIEAGKMDLFIEEFELEDVLDECILTAQGLLNDKDIEFRTEIPSEPIELESDEIKLRQIVNNLLSNAIKFTQSGHVLLQAELEKDASSIHLKIEDSGCGISKEKLEIIFESFKQADSSVKKKFGGTGLGMAITKSFCDMLHIEIEVQSEENKGSTFSLHIPVCFPKKEPQPEISTENEVESSPESTEENLAKKESIVSKKSGKNLSSTFYPHEFIKSNFKAQILCFGNQETLHTLENNIVSLPIQIKQVDNIEQCLEAAKNIPIAMIIVDIDEKEMELLEQLKKEQTTCHIPKIICACDLEQKNLATEAEFLLKPIEKNALLDAMLAASCPQKESSFSILVIDDNPMNCGLVSEIFDIEGYTAYEETFAGRGIALAQEKEIDVVLMDLAMPLMDGFEATKALKKNPKTSQAIVIACSAFSTKDFFVNAFCAGCEGFITKPIDPENIVTEIKNIMIYSRMKKILALSE